MFTRNILFTDYLIHSLLKNRITEKPNTETKKDISSYNLRNNPTFT